MLAKFAVNLLNSWVVIYLSWSVIILFSVSQIFVLWSGFLTKLLTLGILFSTPVRAVVVAKLVILGILFLTSFILALKAVVIVAKLVILGISFLASFILAVRVVLVASLVSGISSSIFVVLALYTSFLTISFLLHHLVYLNQQKQVLSYQHLVYLLFKLVKLVGTFFYLTYLHDILN